MRYAFNASGTKIADYTYDAWGNEESSSTSTWAQDNPVRYNGQYYDTETGMYYLRARYYDPQMSRFISEDPIEDGVNWYAYAGNNPVMLVDPSGLDAIILTNSTSPSILGYDAGHTSALYQDETGNWYYTYWGDDAAAVIYIPEEYMESLSDFNIGLSEILLKNGFTDITPNYNYATYVVGDFTASLDAAYDDVKTANKHINSSKNLYSLPDGSLVYQGHNSPYNVFWNNCLQRTVDDFSKGTLEDGTPVGSYLKDNGYDSEMIPNVARELFSKIFKNTSFVYST